MKYQFYGLIINFREMKKQILITLCILFSITICFAQKPCKELQDFAQDLSSANIKLRGDLMLFGTYKNNLSSLNYVVYLDLLEKSEKRSNNGISKIIRKADNHYFSSETETFKVVVYIKKFNAVIYDDANTAFIDSVKVFKVNDKIPELKSFIKINHLKN
jgi:hypothetical protein